MTDTNSDPRSIQDPLANPERLERFARHIVLPEIGGAGQARLAASHVLVVGAGGIGAPAIQYLAAAGIGKLTIIDDDVVEASNLQRQTIYTESDIGAPKAKAAADWVRRFDPALDVIPVRARIDAGNVRDLISDTGQILDGCDNFATRLAVSDAATALGIPLTSAAVGRFQAQTANFAGHLPDQPCYRCWVGDAFDAEDCDTCAADGVLGAFTGMAGSMAAMMAIRIALDGVSALGDPQWGQLQLFDGLAPRLRTIRVMKDPACRALGHGSTE
ncbi:HesA/MoeB/ThiF family protein [Croceicoccus mobilis]|uniref:Thiamine biosynthesis protein ThiF n=1 Tax=Croceicoccus mobilis TaxID=1703339 RepID=A0A916YSA1_9SPHN|nr:HesA/MoeB/ThiF family protein [Croceicoccus mobilis]GGD59171.1 thiamine biosynthesis protein ThiF [Croceicoccus mobilis]